MTRITLFCIAALSMCARAGAAIMLAVDHFIDRSIDFVCSAVAVPQRLAFDLPSKAAIAAPMGSSFSAVVDRHEAGVSRRSAARNI